MKASIARYGAAWWPPLTALLHLTDGGVIKHWQENDPACWNRNWSEVLVDFARARAEHLGLTVAIEYAVECGACGRGYDPRMIGPALLRRLDGCARVFCDYCLYDAFLRDGNNTASRQAIIEFLTEISRAIGRIPSTSILRDSAEIAGLPITDSIAAIRALTRKPTRKRVNELFGSWLAALVESGLLEGSARPTLRGTQCLALDGHLCRSLAEKTIDDFLFQHGVEHNREVTYGPGFRSDFAVGHVLIEYFGLIGDPQYDARHAAKLAYCEQEHVTLISLYPDDVVNRNRLSLKLERLLLSDNPSDQIPDS